MKPTNMIGHKYLYKSQERLICDLRILEDGTHVVTTDKGELRVTAKQLGNDFLPIEDESSLPALVKQFSRSDISDIGVLSGIIMDSIRKVQKDPAYVPQAHAINEGAKVMVDIKKLVLDGVRLHREMGL